MTLPPGVGRRDFSAALRAFASAVGTEWVFSDAEDVSLYRDAYSPFWDENDERVASAAVAPHSLEQVQEVVRIANRYRIPLYAISTGKNLAYGGSAPVLSGSVVLDLKRMNRVLEVNEQNAYALVEPGVSYFDLYRHIQDRGLKLMLDVPTPGWGSLVGNALDHGVGMTPLRDHFGAQCGMEVVLADGSVLRTGMGALPGAKTWSQYKYGIGPYADGLFSQSNFGIVTKMGFWLLPEPEVVRALRVSAPRHDDVIPMVAILANLVYSGVIDSQFLLDSPVLNGPRDEEFEALAASEGGGDAAQMGSISHERTTAVSGRRASLSTAPNPSSMRAGSTSCERYSSIPGIQFADGPTYRFPMSAETRERARDKAMLGIPSLANFGERTMTRYGIADGHIDFAVVVPMTGQDVLEALKVIGRALAAG